MQRRSEQHATSHVGVTFRAKAAIEFARISKCQEAILPIAITGVRQAYPRPLSHDCTIHIGLLDSEHEHANLHSLEKLEERVKVFICVSLMENSHQV